MFLSMITFAMITTPRPADSHTHPHHHHTHTCDSHQHNNTLPGLQEDAHEFLYCLLNTMEAIQLTNYGGKERFDVR